MSLSTMAPTGPTCTVFDFPSGNCRTIGPPDGGYAAVPEQKRRRRRARQHALLAGQTWG